MTFRHAPLRPDRPVIPACLRPIALLLAFAAAGRAAPDAAGAMRVLKANCLSCHSQSKHKGGFSLHSREALLAGGESGPAFLEGKPDASPLLALLAPDADPHMPPRKQLADGDIALLSAWLGAGAPWDAAALDGDADPLPAVAIADLPPAWHPVAALALSPDGSRLAAAVGAHLLLFQVDRDAVRLAGRSRAHRDQIHSLAWTPDGTRLVSGAFRRVVVWNPQPLGPQHEVVAGLTHRITALQPLRDGRRVAVADGIPGQSGRVRLCDAATGALLKSWKAHDDAIFAMTLSNDGGSLATAAGDGYLKVWDLASGTERLRIEAHATQVLGAALHPDNHQLATGGSDRQLRIWDLRTRENTIAFPVRKAPVNALAWTDGGTSLLAGSDDGRLVRLTGMKPHSGAQSADTGRERPLGSTDAPVFSVAAAPDGSRIFAGSATGRILGWNKDGKLVDDLDAAALLTAPAP